MLILEFEEDKDFNISKVKLILDIAGARTIVATGQTTGRVEQYCGDDVKAGKIRVEHKQPAKKTAACY